MIAFPGLLVGPAEEAGIKVPPGDPDTLEFDRAEFPHWYVFVTMQLGASMPGPTAHWDNAKVVATLSDEEIKTATPEQLIERGFAIGFS